MSGGLVVLNGSPHRDGNGMALAEMLAEELGCDGGGVVLNLYDMNIGLCRGCGGCGGCGGCVLRDEFDVVAGAMRGAAYVALVSPLHFSGLSAGLAGCIGRFQAFWGRSGDGFPGAGALLITGGARYRRMFLGPRKVAAALYGTLGMPFAGLVAVAGTDDGPVRRDDAAVRERVSGLARRMRRRPSRLHR